VSRGHFRTCAPAAPTAAPRGARTSGSNHGAEGLGGEESSTTGNRGCGRTFAYKLQLFIVPQPSGEHGVVKH